MSLTREQTRLALHVHNEMRKREIPELVTTREALDICQDYDLEGKVYYAQRRSSRGVRLVDLAVYIARRSTEQTRKGL
jgi:hypothetical protein